MLAHYLVARDLARANELLEAARVEAPLCPYGQPTARSRALNRVVTQFFVGQVQPWLVRLRQRKEALHQPIKALEAPLGAVLPPDYIDWAMQRDQLLIKPDAGHQNPCSDHSAHPRSVRRVLTRPFSKNPQADEHSPQALWRLLQVLARRPPQTDSRVRHWHIEPSLLH